MAEPPEPRHAGGGQEAHRCRAIALRRRTPRAPPLYLCRPRSWSMRFWHRRAFVQWMLGYPSQTRRFETEALALARRLEHPPSMVQTLRHVCDAQAARSDTAAVLANAAEFLKLGEEHGLPQAKANALIFLGWALTCSGEREEGLARLEEGFEVLNRSGNFGFLSRACCLLGESLLASG